MTNCISTKQVLELSSIKMAWQVHLVPGLNPDGFETMSPSGRTWLPNHENVNKVDLDTWALSQFYHIKEQYRWAQSPMRHFLWLLYVPYTNYGGIFIRTRHTIWYMIYSSSWVIWYIYNIQFVIIALHTPETSPPGAILVRPESNCWRKGSQRCLFCFFFFLCVFYLCFVGEGGAVGVCLFTLFTFTLTLTIIYGIGWSASFAILARTLWIRIWFK